MNTTLKTADGTTTIEADPNLPLVRMSRDFRATPAQLVRAHTDAELFVKLFDLRETETRHRGELHDARGKLFPQIVQDGRLAGEVKLFDLRRERAADTRQRS